ncbi:arylsulfatase G-like, partial [Saccoglossus kowalevskii]
CTPSRASLLTGRLGLRMGVVRNFDYDAVAGLPLNETTFAERFHEAGYRTDVIGKWHLGTNGHYHPNNRGFDYFFGLPVSNDMGCVDKPGADKPQWKPCPNNETKLYQDEDTQRVSCNINEDYALPLYENINILEQPTNLFTLARRLTKKTTKFILNKTDDDQPFLLYMAFTHMHVPITHAPKFNNVSGGSGLYADSLREMDYMVGEIIAAIQKSNKETNTLFWFTGDNGPWDVKCKVGGDRGPFLESWQHTQGTNSISYYLICGGHREPSLAYWPEHISPGQVTNSILSVMDIYPTMAAIAGVVMPTNREYDGVDISDILFNSKEMHERTLFHPNGLIGDVHGRLDGVRMGKYKAVYLTGGIEGCDEPPGQIIEHDPPLIFNIREDNTTVANYDTDVSSRPCSNRRYEETPVIEQVINRRDTATNTDNMWETRDTKSENPKYYEKGYISELLNLFCPTPTFGAETRIEETIMPVTRGALVQDPTRAAQRSQITKLIKKAEHIIAAKNPNQTQLDVLEATITVEDRVTRGRGPTAVASKLGYLLSGPSKLNDVSVLNAIVMKMLTSTESEERLVTKYWDLESIGISATNNQENEVKRSFEQFRDTKIKRDGNRYIAGPPWKEKHTPLPTNYMSAKVRTRVMAQRLSPERRTVYDSIIKE